MSHFGNFRSARFNDEDPNWTKRHRRNEWLRKQKEEQARKEQELKNKQEIEDITNDPTE